MMKSRRERMLLGRRRSRGAAMVEAVVVIPFFVIIFASTVFIGDLYRQKQKAHREATLKAWQSSSLGCSGGLPGIPGPSNIDLGVAATNPAAALCDDNFGEITELGEGSATASGIIGGYTSNLSTETTLICNENPETGNFDGAAEFLWNLFTPEITP